ncbi:MAG: ABC transporter ATP-binding protein [Proteobacteria bacterium]|nr:ABC transporter ATP-binding protein [Pseudomonadota bacterium]
MSQTPPRTPLLEAEDLHTWFELRRFGFVRIGHVRAVDGVDFALYPGESAAFVGESGCGKSTLARTLLGLHPPTRGQVRIEGRPLLSRMGRKARLEHCARIGFVQQDPYGALPPFMSIRQILSEPLRIHGTTSRSEREARIQQALTEVNLRPAADFLPKFPHMLSGGQQQRVVIARALLLAPALLIADEPVSMLDASVRVEVLRLLRNVQRERQLSLAFITHDLSTVRHFADRIFVMYAGKIVESAPVDALLDTPHHPYTRALIDAIADVDADNALSERAIPTGEPPSLVHPPTGCRFHPRCPEFMAGICDVQVPTMQPVAHQHAAACHLYDKPKEP